MNTLYYGDNLDILANKIADESADLIYLDPPFNSDTNYNVLFRSAGRDASSAQLEAFQDTWEWGEVAERAYEEAKTFGNLGLALSGLRKWLTDQSPMMAYLAMMAVRIGHLRRKLKETGTLYLHCDPKAAAYLKTLLDAAFGPQMFTSEIVWKRTNARSTKGKWPALHDVLLCYGGERPRVFNPQRIKADLQKQPHTLITGSNGLKYQTFELTGAGVTKEGETGQSWHGFNPTEFGRHWATGHARLDALEAAGLIHWPKGDGFPRRRAAEPFVPKAREVVVGDVWTDIDRLNQTARERLGYPTQKPLALLERIIAASSNPGDVVLDPFCGCGTAVEAADRLGRQWVGIDISHYAITLIEERFARRRPSAQFEVFGRPTTIAGARDLASRDKYQFQWWAAWLLGAQSYRRDEKKGADRGIDGRLIFRNGPFGEGHIIISVKGGENVGVAMVRDLRGTIEREEAEMGILVTLARPTRPMLIEAAGAGFVERSAHHQLPRIQVITVEDLLSGRPPILPSLPPPQRSISAARRKPASRDQLELTFSFDGGRPIPVKGDFVDPRYLRFGGRGHRRTS